MALFPRADRVYCFLELILYPKSYSTLQVVVFACYPQFCLAFEVCYYGSSWGYTISIYQNLGITLPDMDICSCFFCIFSDWFLVCDLVLNFVVLYDFFRTLEIENSMVDMDKCLHF